MKSTSSPTIGKIVYQYLKRKGRVVPPNLVEDESGNIIYDPQKAMDVIAEKWDSVFSVNAGHSHEMQILKQVWPYIHNKGASIVLPPITEDQLWRQAAKRRPVATLFNCIEAGCIEFPTILTKVRMVIHNKDGSDLPLSKKTHLAAVSIHLALYRPPLYATTTMAARYHASTTQGRHQRKADVRGAYDYAAGD